MNTVKMKAFEKEIGRAVASGNTHFAKAIGSPNMRFGKSLEEAEKKAMQDAKQIQKEFGGSAPFVQSGPIQERVK